MTMLWSSKINSKLHYGCLLCYLLVCVVWAAANNNGSRFGHHCCRRTSPDLIKHGGRHKNINFYFNLYNQLNHFNSGLGTNLPKAAQPSGGVICQIHAAEGARGSTTMVVMFVVCLCCCVMQSLLVVITCM
jgi:hypothetical protein